MTENIKQWIADEAIEIAKVPAFSGGERVSYERQLAAISGLTKGIEIAEGFEKFKIKEGYQLYPSGWYSNEPPAAGKQTWFTFDELLEKYLKTLKP